VLCARAPPRRLAPVALASLLVQGAGPSPLPLAEVVFLDVGQGDAAIVRTPQLTVLIDGGGLVGHDLGATALRPALARRGVSRLDVALLSHSDRDHCQGLLDLAAVVPIGELWSSAGQLADGCGRRLAGRLGGRTRALAAGTRIARGGVVFTVLHPPAQAAPRPANAESLVVAVELAGRRFIFPGDLGAAEEAALAGRSRGLRGAVLKVAHHGAAGSSSPAWLDAIRPRLAVVSAGARNGYGHPAAATLGRLVGRGAVVLRTDRDGEVALVRPPRGPWRLELPGAPRRVAPDR
jgi:competence protein ComEC